MRDTLKPGLELERRYAVTRDMSPAHLQEPVLSTPSMVNLIELTCLALAHEHLDDGETTVGTHICVSHLAPASEGDEIEVRARLAAIDRRRLDFETEVHGPKGCLSRGTHQRAVVTPRYMD